MEKRPTSTRAVDRALSLLVEVTTGDGLGLVELARRTELSPATALRLLRTLEAADFITRDENGAYSGAGRLVEIAIAFMSRNPLYRASDAHLEALRDELDESAYLGVAGPGETVLYARLAECDRTIRHQAWLGKTVPLYGSAVGAALRGEVEAETGYVVVRRTVEDEVTAVAAPVRWGDGAIAGALSVVGPTYRIPDSRAEVIGDRVAEHARALSRELAGGDLHALDPSGGSLDNRRPKGTNAKRGR
ncbi:MAG: helix-turn-helix domain-containing protein [Thermomicrobiales bacterium]|nr:helix-turn-helix domain-containing protein [Thermomicrobiales bacterium]